jgi:hypothetical protein
VVLPVSTGQIGPGKNPGPQDTNTVMTLSTTPSSATRTTRATGVDLTGAEFCAAVCAASAGVHAALVGPHAQESRVLALAFGVSALALALAAIGQILAPSPVMGAAVAALLLAVAGAYLMSRTTGLPGLIAHQEPFDTLGVVTSLLELVGAAVAVRQLSPRRH